MERNLTQEQLNLVAQIEEVFQRPGVVPVRGTFYETGTLTQNEEVVYACAVGAYAIAHGFKGDAKSGNHFDDFLIKHNFTYDEQDALSAGFEDTELISDQCTVFTDEAGERTRLQMLYEVGAELRRRNNPPSVVDVKDRKFVSVQ